MMKQATQAEILLYLHMDEAICQIQILEQALSHCLTVKLNPEVEENEAYIFLSKRPRNTFGKVVMLATENGAFSDSLQKALDELLTERNWLVHHAMRDSQKANRIVVTESFLEKVKSITNKAKTLQQLLEWDLIDFSASKGRNVSKVIEMMIREKGPRRSG